ncbi:hypothetical protein LEP1GSC173_3101 [Leptospira interrogans str. HAI1594]|uniref:Uncharacterized protein n=1 Tax=Leptospira interrogans serovar Hardjo str. Norma TaxID=1279460 RepID=A0A0M4MWP7_LEPIR|nr:hypothetical protein LIL_13028 [Leptospira interrogans serovar Linhai str. 56609]ALE40920.1 hypothetical protein G436_3774 [Leptospira interrogans serovar Hardjo str. Norma]EKP76920.1 hypothetical protein LEP1GSC173_3101 [Leptospira interrogans str. HAI1594]
MWELPQITILQTIPEIVRVHTFRKVFLRRTYAKMGFKF